jgi:outer membrane protein OmpA-like peptidoglycan-associated protein
MVKLIKILLFFCLIFGKLYCQYETNIWYFGNYAGIKFSDHTPTAIFDGAIKTIEGAATISDGNGNLLFYTDGCTVYNKNHLPMKNGRNLMGHFSSTQSGIIVPKPNSNYIYYVFTVDENAGSNGIRYSIVDIRLDKGLGEVIKKNILLYAPTTEKVTAVLHDNNKDYWIITHDWDSRNFRVFQLTESGISAKPVITSIGSFHSGIRKNAIGYLKASIDGTKIALCIRDKSLVELFDFDNITGKISNSRRITPVDYNQPYGIEFSPDGMLLYVSYSRPKSKIIQYNLRFSLQDDIQESAVEIGQSEKDNLFFALQIGPDSKIYIAQYNQPYLGIIEQPNELGNNCRFSENGVFLDDRSSTLGLPNFIQSYFFEKQVVIDTIRQIINPVYYYSEYSIGVPKIVLTNTIENSKTKKLKIYYRTDTLFILGELPDTLVKHFAIDKTGNKLNKKDLIIEEFSQKNLHPLLNYIFFEDNSSIIPDRYKKISGHETATFNVAHMHNFNTLEVYYNILNIVGYRMNLKKDAQLEITGCLSGSNAEKSNKKIALYRAESVKNYLVNTWNIAPDRIKIFCRGLPEQASLPTEDIEKAQENARVEMTSNDHDIFAPLLTIDTLRETDPEYLRFFTTLDHSTGFRSTKVLILNDTSVVTELDPTNTNEEFFDWKIDRNFRDSSLNYTLVIQDQNGKSYKTPVRIIPVNQLTLKKKKAASMKDVEFDNFSLILFDFARSIVSGENTKISDYIRKRIMPDSKVKIYGYTDKTGEDNYNRRLSLHRANQVRDALRLYNAERYGIGEDVLLYDNNLPEGRFYCRTVQIIVETPSIKN